MLFCIARKANNKSKNYYNTKKNNCTSINLLAFICSILGGGIIGITTIYLLQYKYHTNKSISVTNPTNKAPIKMKTNTTKNNAIGRVEHNYDFYNILTSSPNNITIKDKTTKHSYLLSLGDFNNLTNADELKAKLALQGFEAKIENTASTSNKNNNYRVIIGPFDSEILAKQQKSKLNLAGFNNKLIKTN
jgi:cell division protein FtsN